MHPRVGRLAGWLAGGRAWPGGLKGCGLPVSHRVDHVAAVAAEGLIFLLGNRTAWVGKGRRIFLQPVACQA